ncbi:sensor histidine kinase [Actinoplanes sp. NPDC051861]|uniref:sensor histidine kinase n=1 Tax=Actinoplanes sp. NPDC051861 TaxID=3155170 RepID=UPI003412AD95
MLRTTFTRLTALWRAGRLTVWADVLLVVFLTLAAVSLTGERGDVPAPAILWPGPQDGQDAPAGIFFAAEPTEPKATLLAENLLLTAPLLLRRRWPLAAFAFQFLAFSAIDIEGNLANLSALLIGAYSMAVYGRSVWLSMGTLLTVCLIVAVQDENTWPSLPGWTGVFVLLVPIGLLGVAIRAARSRALASEQRARALEREQQAATRLAVVEERARIARELHDVVSHHVSVMTIQAGAAGKVLDAHPEMARDALAAVESSGRETMAELRQLLGVLAPGPDDDLLHPQPGLDQLEPLVDKVRNAGQPITLDVTPVVLPHGLDLAAFRVVQEGLTNALRHAPGAKTEVTVTVEPSGTGKDLVVSVVNEAPPPRARQPASTGAGSGLVGLTERLRVYGGKLGAGRRVGGGFQVYARMPLPTPDTTMPAPGEDTP